MGVRPRFTNGKMHNCMIQTSDLLPLSSNVCHV
jgi:hypothetical protein